jgi:squalene-hopene/tetraprenyl-beta-curcumene cyclase
MVQRAVGEAHRAIVQRLLQERTGDGVWVGELASSALSTATAAIALSTAAEGADDRVLVQRALQWLAQHQNADGGWGDTIKSRSNISTTALCWAALSFAPPADASSRTALTAVEAWLAHAAGGLGPEQLAQAITRRYGKDRTFSAPILTALAVAGRLGADGWRLVPQLPFELAACPQRWFQFLQLPVVSYALPALIAIGQVRHAHRPSRNLPLRFLRDRCVGPTLRVLRRVQPSTGGYLEATPLTSFVVMSLVSAGERTSPVVAEGLRFLRASAREDGSWPIDTNLSTWVTTLAINAVAVGHDGPGQLERRERAELADWLLRQQHRVVHPYTGAAPGGWAWTPLAGGVPDADDTAGALIALKLLGSDDERTREAAARGVQWLLDLQNRDGGIPTFCRGWGALPFDRSAPDLTAHALLAWRAWREALPDTLSRRTGSATQRALAYLRSSQRSDGAWVPLWFGNEHSAGEANPTYGTSKVVLALARLSPSDPMLSRGCEWLIGAQGGDGGWGGDVDTPSSIEETSFALDALAACSYERRRAVAIQRGAEWVVRHTSHATALSPSPIGLYFAKLWYFEKLYPLVYASGALGRVLSAQAAPTEQQATV